MSETNSDKDKLNDNKQYQFHEALAFLIESANLNSGMVTMDEIHKTFENIIDDESMYQHIYNYLLENKIGIQDYLHHTVSTNDNESSEEPDTSMNKYKEDKKLVEMYLDEINLYSDLKKEVELELLKSLHDATTESITKNAINKLIEGNLKLVISIVEDYKNKGIAMGDLLQEGNLGLIEGVTTYFKNDKMAVINLLEFHDYLSHCISHAISDAIQEQNTTIRIGSHLADNANRLDYASVELSQDLGRTPTVEEIANYLSISTQEVERIMKMSLDALNVDNAEGKENE